MSVVASAAVADTGTEVLLVEDNLVDARILEVGLRARGACGVNITHVATMADALRRLERGRFDVVLLDLHLPDSDGLEGVRMVDGAARGVPVVVLTGSDDEDLALNAVKAGAQDYLVKGRGDAETVLRALRYAIERKETQRQLERLAWHDVLTGLANRALFNDRLQHAIARARRLQERVALVYVDLDGFKPVNDTLGHEAGDAVLVEIARRLQAAVRESDTVARLGGDEFAVVLEGMCDDAALAQVADKLVQLLQQPVVLGEERAKLSGSLGVSVFPEDGQDAHGLVRCADGAMYLAKQEGGGCYRFAAAARDHESKPLKSLSARLRESVNRAEFLLLYQPEVHLQTGAVVAAEALLRWRPEEAAAVVEPADFLRDAETAGLMIPLGEWVLRRACRQAAVWRDALGRVLPVSVNVSASQLAAPGFPGLVARVLAEHDLPPAALRLEITEGVLQRETRELDAVLAALAAGGTDVALDDFGSGYSSLSALRGLRLRQVKVAADFVSDPSPSACDGGVAKAIADLARTLGMSVSAKGIENEEQARRFLLAGCELGQGYHIGRPMDAESLLEMARGHAVA